MTEALHGPGLKLTVVPVNGWGNRLRAMAACSMLARHLGAHFRVAWRDEPGMFIGAWSTVFSPETDIEIIEYKSLRTEFEIEEALPAKYLSTVNNGKITLRGYDLGEQKFIPELLKVVKAGSVDSIAIFAGNHFTLCADDTVALSELENAKCNFYAKLKFTTRIESQIVPFQEREYSALHLRHGDRRDWAPSEALIFQRLESLVKSGHRWVVVGDDHREIRKWVKRIQRMGANALAFNKGRRARSTEADFLLAVAEWRVLSMARELVHFKHSSFSTEAAVVVQKSGGNSIAI